MILILEDDEDRLSRFATVLRDLCPTLPLKAWHNGHRMAREVEPYLAAARLISLDHDLEPCGAEKGDPGSGMEVVRFLVTQPPVCPVIIHSSNWIGCDRMAGEFELAGWQWEKVAPIGEDWIEEYWQRVVRKLLRRRHARRRRR